jgi:hypothetical protein
LCVATWGAGFSQNNVSLGDCISPQETNNPHVKMKTAALVAGVGVALCVAFAAADLARGAARRVRQGGRSSQPGSPLPGSCLYRDRCGGCAGWGDAIAWRSLEAGKTEAKET